MARLFENVVGEARSVVDLLAGGQFDNAKGAFLIGEMKSIFGDTWVADTPAKRTAAAKLETKYREVKEMVDYMREFNEQLTSAGDNAGAKAAILDNFETEMRPRLYSALKKRFF